MSRWQRTSAWLTWRGSHHHHEEYADDNRFGIDRLLPSTELVVAAAIVVFFFGSYAAFLTCLAMTR